MGDMIERHECDGEPMGHVGRKERLCRFAGEAPGGLHEESDTFEKLFECMAPSAEACPFYEGRKTMAEIEWVEELVRDAVVVLTDGIPCQWHRCTCIRKLATAVRLSEEGFQMLEGSGGLDAVRVLAGMFLTRLRSGDVEGK